MKIKRKGYGVVFTILSCIAALAVTLSVVAAYISSTVTVTSNNGETISVFVSDIERGEVGFEDSELFNMLLRDAAEDITRMNVIKNQMETDGIFDADKPIDIVKYANRTDDYEVSTSDVEDVNVEYRLDDLIKWEDNGYDVIPVTGTDAQISAYFYSLTEGVRLESGAYEGDVEHFSSDELLYGGYFPSPDEKHDDEEIYTDYLLIERYKTSDNRKLEDIAASRREYKTLVRDLILAAKDLGVNYSEYMQYEGRYSAQNTNVLYCYQIKNSDGKMMRYNNISGKTDNLGSLSGDEINKIFTGMTKYVCFDPAKLQTATNIDGLNSIDMRELIRRYDYSFTDGARIWIGFDGSYEVADAFSRAKTMYNSNREWFVPACAAGIASAAIYLILLVIMTLQAGKVSVTDEEGEKTVKIMPLKVDRIPIGILAALVFLVFCAAFGAAETIWYETGDMMRGDSGNLLVFTLWGVTAVLFNAILIPLYLIFVRKIKCKLIWETSLTKLILNKIGKLILSVYDNGKVVVRVWLPYLLFLAFNLVLVLLGAGGIFIAFLADLVVGYLLYKDAKTRNDIVDGISRISDGEISHKIDTKKMHGDNLALAGAVNSIGDGISKAVATSMRDEKMKADLITNVSHDIKTPLTSIINYVDLLKRENIENEKINGYVEILDQKSQRLKQLTDDLVEASKISSGNIALTIEKINFVELINQSLGEFSEKFLEKDLKTMISLPTEPVNIMADSRAVYRVVENLYNNIYKYALEGTRVYVDMMTQDNRVSLAIKNISADPLGINVDDLTERFMRGDSSRKTEGSGLGLSIAKSLMEAMKGSFELSLDGDLFKVVIGFDRV